MKTRYLVVSVSAWALFPLGVSANPIPVPTPASMPLEQMRITIGGDRHVVFSGDFTFGYIPASVTSMLFPVPPINVGSVEVFQDGTLLSWGWSSGSYPTVLPEYPALSLFEWAGPFPQQGAVFTVNYEHDLFPRGNDWVFVYSLGTGKYFPTYEKITTASFEIELPSNATLTSVQLDDTPIDPSLYTLHGTHLDLTLTSEFGPFRKDLILVLTPEPASLGLVGAALLGIAGLRGAARARKGAGAELKD